VKKYQENSFLKAKDLSEGEIKLRNHCSLCTISSYGSIQAPSKVGESVLLSLWESNSFGRTGSNLLLIWAVLPHCTTAP